MGGDCGHLLRRGVASLNEFSGGTFQFTALLGSRVREKLSICNPDTVRSAGLPQSAVGTSAGELKVENYLRLVQVRVTRFIIRQDSKYSVWKFKFVVMAE